MTVVITGAAGFVGLNLIKRLAQEGHEITALDFNPARYFSEPGTKWEKCDVTNREDILQHLTKDVDTVYHLAGVVGVKNYLKNPMGVINVNFESTRYIVEAAKKYDFTTLFASTSEIFGKNPSIPWKEDDDRVLGTTKKARWVYSTSKALSEHLLFAEAENYGIRNVIVRFFNLYGPYQKPVNVVPRMITSLIMGNKVPVYDNGQQTRCFTYIDDAIDAVVSLVKDFTIKNDAFNIGSNLETKIVDLAEVILKQMGKGKEHIEFLETKSTIGQNYEDIDRRVPDVTKIKESIGWKIRTDLNEGIKKTIEWYDVNKNWWQPYF